MSELKFHSQGIYFFNGPLQFQVKQGLAEAVGAPLDRTSGRMTIPRGKSIPVEGKSDGIFEIMEGDDTNIEKLEHRTIPAAWDSLVRRILDEKVRKVVVLGGTDTGKSFFTTYLANRLLGFGRKAGVIDCDLGQSDIGPPGTIGLVVLEKPVMFLHDARIHSLEFVGSHSASLHLINTLLSFHRIVELSLKSAEVTLVNTSGWVLGDGGRLLVAGTLELFDPDIIVILQRERECEHLVMRVFPKHRIVSMVVPLQVLETSRGEREILRNLSSQTYFQQAREVELDLDELETDGVFFKTGVPLRDLALKTKNEIYFAEQYASREGVLIISQELFDEKERRDLKEKGLYPLRNMTPRMLEGLMLGLRDEAYRLLDVGLLKKIDFLNKKVNMITPYRGEARKIRIIQFGALRYKMDGTENGFCEPGNL